MFYLVLLYVMSSNRFDSKKSTHKWGWVSGIQKSARFKTCPKGIAQSRGIAKLPNPKSEKTCQTTTKASQLIYLCPLNFQAEGNFILDGFFAFFVKIFPYKKHVINRYAAIRLENIHKKVPEKFKVFFVAFGLRT